jgi:hypothetical protein
MTIGVAPVAVYAAATTTVEPPTAAAAGALESEESRPTVAAVAADPVEGDGSKVKESDVLFIVILCPIIEP